MSEKQHQHESPVETLVPHERERQKTILKELERKGTSILRKFDINNQEEAIKKSLKDPDLQNLFVSACVGQATYIELMRERLQSEERLTREALWHFYKLDVESNKRYVELIENVDPRASTALHELYAPAYAEFKMAIAHAAEQLTSDKEGTAHPFTTMFALEAPVLMLDEVCFEYANGLSKTLGHLFGGSRTHRREFTFKTPIKFGSMGDKSVKYRKLRKMEGITWKQVTSTPFWRSTPLLITDEQPLKAAKEMVIRTAHGAFGEAEMYSDFSEVEEGKIFQELMSALDRVHATLTKKLHERRAHSPKEATAPIQESTTASVQNLLTIQPDEQATAEEAPFVLTGETFYKDFQHFLRNNPHKETCDAQFKKLKSMFEKHIYTNNMFTVGNRAMEALMADLLLRMKSEKTMTKEHLNRYTLWFGEAFARNIVHLEQLPLSFPKEMISFYRTEFNATNAYIDNIAQQLPFANEETSSGFLAIDPGYGIWKDTVFIELARGITKAFEHIRGQKEYAHEFGQSAPLKWKNNVTRGQQKAAVLQKTLGRLFDLLRTEFIKERTPLTISDPEKLRTFVSMIRLQASLAFSQSGSSTTISPTETGKCLDAIELSAQNAVDKLISMLPRQPQKSMPPIDTIVLNDIPVIHPMPMTENPAISEPIIEHIPQMHDEQTVANAPSNTTSFSVFLNGRAATPEEVSAVTLESVRALLDEVGALKNAFSEQKQQLSLALETADNASEVQLEIERQRTALEKDKRILAEERIALEKERSVLARSKDEEVMMKRVTKQLEQERATVEKMRVELKEAQKAQQDQVEQLRLITEERTIESKLMYEAIDSIAKTMKETREELTAQRSLVARQLATLETQQKVIDDERQALAHERAELESEKSDFDDAVSELEEERTVSRNGNDNGDHEEEESDTDAANETIETDETVKPPIHTNRNSTPVTAIVTPAQLAPSALDEEFRKLKSSVMRSTNTIDQTREFASDVLMAITQLQEQYPSQKITSQRIQQSIRNAHPDRGEYDYRAKIREYIAAVTERNERLSTLETLINQQALIGDPLNEPITKKTMLFIKTIREDPSAEINNDFVPEDEFYKRLQEALRLITESAQ